MPFLTPTTREKIPAIVLQAAVILLLVFVLREIVGNAQSNLQRLGMNAGFSFLKSEAGFDISQKLINFQQESSYLKAIVTGYLNTLVLAIVSIFLCTVIGLVVAFARFSINPLIAVVAEIYVEVFRNVPLLLQIFFWYFGVIASLPNVKNSFSLGPIYLNNRGLYFPSFGFTSWGWLVLVIDLLSIISIIFILRKSYSALGYIGKKAFWQISICVIIPIMLYIFGGNNGEWDIPALSGFRFRGGLVIMPEFVAMAIGLSIYNSTFMSEIFRSGILSVPKGQFEAAASVGLSGAKTNLFIILPQALRVAIPPAGGQLQVIIKASSLSAAVAYPDIMSVVGGSILQMTGQAIECMFIVMMLYLMTNLTLTALLNIYNNIIMRRGGK